MNTLTAGAAAPDFTLEDQNGNATSLSQFRGQVVVIYFYPKAMTPGCTVQACSLRDSESDLAGACVKVLGLSPDPVKRLKKFDERDGLNFTLLSDEDHAVADKFGVWGLKKFMGREYDGIQGGYQNPPSSSPRLDYAKPNRRIICVRIFNTRRPSSRSGSR